MIHFPNATLQRYSYARQDGGGIYGESIYEYTYIDDVLVDFQNEGNAEVAHSYGVELQNLYKIYADESISLNDNDKFKDAEGNMYHIIGNIQKYNHFHHYQKAHLVKERRT